MESNFSTEAVSVFDDPELILITDDDSDANERRFVSVGISLKARVLVVVHGYREGDTIRIISARKATAREEKEYWNQ